MLTSQKKKRLLLADSDDEDTEDINETNTNFQLQAYREQKESVKKDEDPILWWKRNQNRFPAVATLAMKYLTIVATSVPSERLFSQAGFLISQQRSRLLPSRVNDMLFLNSYLKFEGKIKTVSTLFQHFYEYFSLSILFFKVLFQN